MATFTFNNVLGQYATLHINNQGNHMAVTWGELTVTDTFGHVGFWESFSNSHCKGAAYASALRKHARSIIEQEIYVKMRYLME